MRNIHLSAAREFGLVPVLEAQTPVNRSIAPPIPVPEATPASQRGRSQVFGWRYAHCAAPDACEYATIART